MAVDDALDAEPFSVGEAFGDDELDSLGAGAVGDGLGDGVLAGVFDRCGDAEHLVRVLVVGRDDVDEGHAPGGDGAGLVEHDGVDALGGLEHLGTLDQDAELRASSRADHERGGGGETEGAGAGDDQHCDSGGEGGGRAVRRGGGEPEPERGEGQRDHDGHEDRGYPVGEPLDSGLAGLGLLDELGDLGQGGVGTDPGRPDDQPSASVDGGAGNRIAGADLHGYRLAREQRGIDG